MIMKLFHYIYFWLFYLTKIVVSGMLLSWVILTRARSINGGEITFKTGLKKDWHKVALFNLISMTPGTLSIDIDPSNEILTIHLVDMSDEADTVKTCKKLEELIRKAF
ncbi:multiple resistance and pH homeostasis system, subunit E [Marinilabiliaceae bacterium JC017]|nr:multiple resistance and pH homeostasis system, subunit E [Marinilabiliaceae bacterium JC017]